MKYVLIWICGLALPALMGLALSGIAATAAAATSAAATSAQLGPRYANLQGELLLDNPRVFVQKFIVQPGQSTGRRSPSGDQLLVFVKGGVLTSHATGRSTLWRDGRVVWYAAAEGADEGSTNTGS